MALTFEDDPNDPTMTYAVDAEQGLRRLVYDPNRELRDGMASMGDNAGRLKGQNMTVPALDQYDAEGSSAGAQPIEHIPPPEAAPTAPAAASWQAAQRGAPPMSAPAGPSAAPMPPLPPGTELKGATYKPGEPGIPYDQESADQRAEQSLDQKLQVQAQLDRESNLRAQQTVAMSEEIRKREADAKIQSAKADRYGKELDDVVKREIDPDRLAKSEGFGGALLGIFGALAATVSTHRAENVPAYFAAMDRRIERDIAAQKEQKGSAISNLTQKLGSAQQAADHYRATAYQLGSDRFKALLEGSAKSAEYEGVLMQMDEKRMAYEQAAKAASFGKPGRWEDLKFEAKKPVGGPAALTGEEKQAQALAALPPGAEKYQQEELAKLATLQGMKPEQVRNEWDKWNGEHGKNASVRQTLADVRAVIEPAKGSNDVAGAGLIAKNLPQWLLTAEGRNVQSKLGMMEAFLLHDLSGAAVSPEELARIHKVIEGTGTYDDLKAGLDTVERATTAMNKHLDLTNRSFARVRNETEKMVARETAASDSSKAAQDARNGKGKPEPGASAPKPRVSQARSTSAMLGIEEEKPAITPEQAQREVERRQLERFLR